MRASAFEPARRDPLRGGRVAPSTHPSDRLPWSAAGRLIVAASAGLWGAVGLAAWSLLG